LPAKVAVVRCESYERSVVESSILTAVNLIGGINTSVKAGDRVLLKPNLCLPEPPERCLTTHPEVVRCIAQLCIKAGAKVIIGDNPVGEASPARLDHIWDSTGMSSVTGDLNCSRSLLDKDITAHSCTIEDNEYSFFISREVFSADSIINMPKFKTHSLMTFTGAVKNLYGLLPGNSKKKLHSELPEHDRFAELLTAVYKLVKPKLHIMDAVIGIEGDGPGTRGEKRYIGLILAGTDGIALDAVSSMLMNVKPSNVPTNRIGGLLGLGENDIEKIEVLGESLDKYIIKNYKLPMTCLYHSKLTQKLFNIARAYIKINTDKCKRCGLCIENCPNSAVKDQDGTVYIDQKTCIACMTCQEICPSGAVESKRPDFYKQLKQLDRNKSTN